MRSRLMFGLALCVLMLPLLNACAASQEASVPSLAGRAAAAVSAAQTARVAQASALKAAGQPSSDSSGAVAASSGDQPLWQGLIERARSPKPSASRSRETSAQPFWDTVLNRIKSMKSTGADNEDAFSLPSIWRSVYENYREAQISRSPGGLGLIVPQ